MAQTKHRDDQLFVGPVEFDALISVEGGETVDGPIIHRPATGQPLLKKVDAPSTGTTSTDMSEVQLLGGIHVKTPAAAQNFQVPTGTEISAALVAIGVTPLVGDSFDFTLINLGGAGDIVTLTVATGVTFVGSVTIDDPGADINSSGTFRFRNTAANTWIAYRVT